MTAVAAHFADSREEVLMEPVGKTTFVALVVLALGCAGRRFEERPPRVRLTAEAKHVFAFPATVQFHAFIDGGRNDDPELYCLDVVWDFQGVEYLDERDCDPYVPGSRIQRAFVAEKTFELEGHYEVEVRLLQRGRTVLTGRVEVVVRRNALIITKQMG